MKKTHIVIRHKSFSDQHEIDRGAHGPTNQIKSVTDAERAIVIACRPKIGMTDENIRYWAAQKDFYSIVQIETIETVLRSSIK